MRPFPQSFDLSALVGPRGRQFSRREDAFQQLVGDGIRELCGGDRVHVAPTRGRDGSIDVLVESAKAENDGRLPRWPKPLIVECKDHDEAGSDLRRNVIAGWTTVAHRLERQASQGWPGNYAPWRSARAYIYAVSARFSAAQHRIELRGRIVEFFGTLSAPPPLERVDVLDWSDLCALWAGVPRLTDQWLGVGLETLLGHAEQMERLTGFRGYLLEANLPFLAPPSDDPAHPARLLACLSQPGRERGLLLEGPGGVGKSRTLIEVAAHADAADWRVLHAQAGEPPLDDDDLEAAVLAGSGSALLILDYLDQMQLDLVRLRQRLLPAAAGRGIRLALLANARPGADRPDAVHDLFDVVPLRPTVERARAITERLLARVAPMALARLGKDALVQICGVRPIVALFIAREIERREEEGILDEERLANVRSGDLTGWLRRRLAESDLIVPSPPSRLEPAVPGPHLVGAAAILATAPGSDVELTVAGERALRAAGLDPKVDSVRRAGRLLAVLNEMGWLEIREVGLAAAHDVVADEVVHDVIADRPATLVRKLELEALLAPALVSARAFGRLAVALRRVLGMEGIAESVAAGLSAMSAGWLARSAVGLGRLLARADVDEVSFALGAVVHGDPWAESTFTAWDTLVEPFLSARAEHPAARHLLYRGLAKLPEGHSGLLFPVALRWLDRNGSSPDASFVLRPLLGREDLGSVEVQEAVSRGLAWLESFGGRAEAQFVLHSLLGRPDLEQGEAAEAVSRGLAWLESFGGRAEAQFVLHSLLGRPDLEQGWAAEAVSRGLVWLKNFSQREDAQFVLTRLLGRDDMAESQVGGAVNHGLAWLESFGGRAEARFVLHSLLGRPDLEQGWAAEAVSRGLVWLESFGETDGAGFVLAPLLRRRDLNTLEVGRAVARAIEWLEADRVSVGEDFVLNELLSRDDLASADLVKAQTLAASWVRTHPSRDDSSFMLKRLLTRRDLPSEVVGEVVVSGVIWLDANATHPSADFVFSRLLRRVELDGAARQAAVTLGIAWLRQALPRDDRDFALSSLLWNSGLMSESDRQFLAHDTLDWLALSPRSHDTRRRLTTLLRRAATEHPDESWVSRLGSLQGADPTNLFAVAEQLAERARAPDLAPEAAWLHSILQQVELHLEGGNVASVGYTLPPLLPLAARVEDRSILARVSLLVRRFLDSPSLTRSHRFGFSSACYRYLDDGAWPDRAFGAAVLTDLAIARQTLFRLESEANELAAQVDLLPSPDWLDRALDETAEPIEAGFPKAAGFLFPPLLALAARLGAQPTLERLHSQIRTLLADTSFSANGRRRLAQACYRFVDDGAWPNRGEGETVLRSLGLQRPEPGETN